MKPRFLCRPLTPSISVLLLLCNNPTTRTSTTEPLHFKLLETPSPFLCTFTVNFHRPTFCLTVTLQKVTTLRWIISQWSQISYTSIVFNRRGHGDFDFSHLKHDTSLPNYFHNSDHSHNMNSTKQVRYSFQHPSPQSFFSIPVAKLRLPDSSAITTCRRLTQTRTKLRP